MLSYARKKWTCKQMHVTKIQLFLLFYLYTLFLLYWLRYSAKIKFQFSFLKVIIIQKLMYQSTDISREKSLIALVCEPCREEMEEKEHGAWLVGRRSRVVSWAGLGLSTQKSLVSGFFLLCLLMANLTNFFMAFRNLIYKLGNEMVNPN